MQDHCRGSHPLPQVVVTAVGIRVSATLPELLVILGNGGLAKLAVELGYKQLGKAARHGHAVLQTHGAVEGTPPAAGTEWYDIGDAPEQLSEAAQILHAVEQTHVTIVGTPVLVGAGWGSHKMKDDLEQTATAVQQALPRSAAVGPARGGNGGSLGRIDPPAAPASTSRTTSTSSAKIHTAGCGDAGTRPQVERSLSHDGGEREYGAGGHSLSTRLPDSGKGAMRKEDSGGGATMHEEKVKLGLHSGAMDDGDHGLHSGVRRYHDDNSDSMAGISNRADIAATHTAANGGSLECTDPPGLLWTNEDPTWDSWDHEYMACSLNALDKTGQRFTGQSTAFVTSYQKQRHKEKERQPKLPAQHEQPAAGTTTVRAGDIELILSVETTVALHQAWTKIHGESKAFEAAENWTKQAAALRRGWEHLRAGKIEPVRAVALINSMCDSMMDTLHATLSCDE